MKEEEQTVAIFWQAGYCLLHSVMWRTLLFPFEVLAEKGKHEAIFAES
jgi:hypothetical protein